MQLVRSLVLAAVACGVATGYLAAAQPTVPPAASTLSQKALEDSFRDAVKAWLRTTEVKRLPGVIEEQGAFVNVRRYKVAPVSYTVTAAGPNASDTFGECVLQVKRESSKVMSTRAEAEKETPRFPVEFEGRLTMVLREGRWTFWRYSEPPLRSAGVRDFRIINIPAPSVSADLAKIKGRNQVKVRFTATGRGTVENVTVTSSTDPRFNEAAIAAIRKATFHPGTQFGEPRDVTVVHAFHFDVE